MRSVQLAVYADTLSAQAAALAARVERARHRLRQAAIEQEARQALQLEIVAQLERLGLLVADDPLARVEDLASTRAALAAVEQLQAWVEHQLSLERARVDASTKSGPEEVMLVE